MQLIPPLELACGPFLCGCNAVVESLLHPLSVWGMFGCCVVMQYLVSFLLLQSSSWGKRESFASLLWDCLLAVLLLLVLCVLSQAVIGRSVFSVRSWHFLVVLSYFYKYNVILLWLTINIVSNLIQIIVLYLYKNHLILHKYNMRKQIITWTILRVFIIFMHANILRCL